MWLALFKAQPMVSCVALFKAQPVLSCVALFKAQPVGLVILSAIQCFTFHTLPNKVCYALC